MMLNEGNQIHNCISSSGSGTVINYGSGSSSDFLTSYGSGSGSTSQKVTVPTVPVPQRWIQEIRDEEEDSNDFYSNYGEEYDEGGGWGGEGEQPLQQPVPTPSGSRGEGGQPGSGFFFGPLDPDPGPTHFF